jgi:hypothetical protein
MSRLQKNLLLFVGLWLLLFAGFMYMVAVSDGSPYAWAMVKMTWGLILVWIVIGGSIMYVVRNCVQDYVRTIRFPWQVTFVLFCTLLALVEEAITTTLTNLAPLFGVPLGTAFITASTNYFEVVFYHSVIVFIPLFIAWAFILTRYDFKPVSVALLFGAMGIVCESTIIGPASALIGAPQWLFVYGLMMYLPAYCVPENRGARPVRVWHHVLAIPIAFLIALPLLLPIVYLLTQVLEKPAGFLL